MKSVKHLFLPVALIAAAALLYSCSEELMEDMPSAKSSVSTLTAHQEGDGLKATYDGKNINWDADDAISVFAEGSSSSVRFDKKSGDNSSFEYSGEIDLKDIYALFPYNSSASIAGGRISTVIKTTQTATPDSFAPDANVAVGYSLQGDEVYFKNAVSYIKISFRTTVSDPSIRKITLQSLDESVLLTGNAVLTPTISDGMVTDVTTEVLEGGKNYVELTGDIQPDTDYYLVVAPVKLTGGFRIIFTDDKGRQFSKDYTAEKNKAQLLRNNISSTGVKNLDNYEISGYFRVLYSESQNHPGAGNYQVVYKMPDGSYRILNEDKTDTYIVKGTHFELSGTTMAFNETYKRAQMEGMVAYVFRNAWLSSASDSEITYADDALILSSGTPVTVGSYKIKSGISVKTFYFTNVTLYNRKDNTTVKLTLDNLTCSLGESTNAGTVSGKFFSPSDPSINPDGNANSCSDLVDALLMHATFSGFDGMVKNAAVEALQGDDNTFTGGFTTASHTSKNNVVSVNHFMIKTAKLLSGAQISDVWLYKWGTKTYSEYINNK